VEGTEGGGAKAGTAGGAVAVVTVVTVFLDVAVDAVVELFAAAVAVFAEGGPDSSVACSGTDAFFADLVARLLCVP
jgi:hypothetical protein